MAALLQFTVGNYRSFHQARIFSMVPNSIQDNPKGCVVTEGRCKYLTTAAVYGANSSGKSNLIAALAIMKNMVLSSVKLNDHDPLPYDPFLLSKESSKQPIHLEVLYLDTDETRIRYGFDYTMRRIEQEWLFVGKKTSKNSLILSVTKKVLVWMKAYFRKV